MNRTQHIATGIKNLKGNEILAMIQATKEGTMVAIKPLCAALGLSWGRQAEKLQEDARFSCTHMCMTGADGKRYEMVCLPAEQVADWVNSINARKVSPEKAQALLELQKFFQYAINEFMRERYVTAHELEKMRAEMTAAFEQRVAHYEHIVLKQSKIIEGLERALQRITAGIGYRASAASYEMHARKASLKH